MKLLIAEDDPKLLKTLTRLFEMNNYCVDGVDNGSDALEYASSGEYDGLVLDVMMPEADGIEVLSALRRRGINTPALFLSARTEVYQRVEGLDAGADDYLSKPFSTQELLARVRAMLRRRENYIPDALCLGELVLDRSTYEISYKGSSMFVTRKESLILEMLIEAHGSIISAEQLITHIWGWDTSVDTSVIWVHISNIRKKLEALGAPVSLRFARGVGYILEVRDD